MLWVNLHSGAVLFLAILLIYAGVELAQRNLGWRAAQKSDLGMGSLWRIGILCALVAAALLITPNHVRLPSYILESSRINSPRSLEWFSIACCWRMYACLRQ